MPDKNADAIAALVLAAQQNHHRYLLTLCGDQAWLAPQLRMVLHEQQPLHTVCLGDAETIGPTLVEQPTAASPIRYLTADKAPQLLGTEIDLLIVDTRCGFNPNAVTAASGAVVGGGLMLLILPEPGLWCDYQDPDYQRMLVYPFKPEQSTKRFLQRLQTTLAADSRVLSLKQNTPAILTGLEWTPPANANPQSTSITAALEKTGLAQGCLTEDCLTQDQALCVAAILRVSNGHAKRPLVIRADRGRGKSTALGIAAAHLMLQRPLSIIITAPRPDAVDACFVMTAQLLQLEKLSHQPKKQQRKIQYSHAELRFVAADELVRSDYNCDLLLVDEAAALPVPLLDRLLQRYNRAVFSTTVHGYEGSGRGFDIRFKALLEQQRPHYRSVSLTTPIRWADNDPLEQWIFNAFLLSAEPCDNSELHAFNIADCHYEKVNRDELLQTPDLLEQLFGLLVAAHYQTSPDDLRSLLDGPNISLWLGRVDQRVVAVAMLADEGGFNDSNSTISTDIWQGKRRPRGHLMAQTLSAHTGLIDAPKLRYRRIIRIAVHPALHRKGLGRQLMTEIIHQARRDNIDCLGSSFAATADVVAFWQALEFVPARLGVSRDSSSGCFSALMMCALSAPGIELLLLARQRFVEHFCFSLDRCYQQLEADLVLALLHHCGDYSSWILNQQDWLDIESFAKGYRQLPVCIHAVWKFTGACLADMSLRTGISREQRILLVVSLLQQHTVGAAIKRLSLSGDMATHTVPTGKKQLEQQLREAVGILRDKKLLAHNNH